MAPFLCRVQLVFSLSVGMAAAQAQTMPAVAPPAAAPVVAAPAFINALSRADTARAVQELFRSRRGGGAGWLALGTVGILASTLPAQQSTSAGVWTPGVVAGSVFFLIGLNKRIQFRPGREQRVLRELAASGHLPLSVVRRLRGNFAPLHGTASEANPLLALNQVPAARVPDLPAAAPPTTPTTVLPAGPALAPSPAAPPTTAPPAAVPALPTPSQLLADAHTDTLDAVQGLFLSRRGAGTWPLVALLPVARILAGATNTDLPNNPVAPQTTSPSGGSVALGLGLMGAGLVYMLVHNAPYTDAHLQILKSSYSSGQPLPASIRSSLRPRHQELGRKFRQRQERRALRRSR